MVCGKMGLMLEMARFVLKRGRVIYRSRRVAESLA